MELASRTALDTPWKGGVAATSRKCSEGTSIGADGVVSRKELSSMSGPTSTQSAPHSPEHAPPSLSSRLLYHSQRAVFRRHPSRTRGKHIGADPAVGMAAHIPPHQQCS